MHPVRVSFVVAAGENWIIGRSGRLPWRMPGDLRVFRRLTLGKPVIMGRKTFASIGKPLDGRDNIVLTRDTSFSPAGVHVLHDATAALAKARELAASRGADEVAVIGGAEVFRAMLPYAGRIYLTRIAATPAGDVSFPVPDPAEWRESSRQPIERHAKDEHAAELIVLDRVPCA